MSTMAPSASVHIDGSGCEHPDTCGQGTHFHFGGLPSPAWHDDES